MKRKKDSQKNLTLLTFDPTLRNPTLLKDLKTVALLVNPLAPIQPLGVMTPRDLHWPLEVAPSQIGKVFRTLPTAANVVLGTEGQLPSEGGLASRLLVVGKASIKETVKAVLEYSTKEKASMAALFTHGRQGVQKWRLGSFTDTFLSNSQLPALVLNPSARIPRTIQSILHPSDLAVSNQRFFLDAVQRAKAINANLILYHRRSFMEPLLLTALGARIDSKLVQEAWMKDEKRQTRIGKKWIEKALKAGVRCEFVIDRYQGPLPNCLWKYAKEHDIDLIHLGIRSEGKGRRLGSTLREMIATSPCPILVEGSGRLSVMKSNISSTLRPATEKFLASEEGHHGFLN